MHKTVVITGAGRGIGAATAKKLASQGYAVVVNYRRDAKSADKVAKDIVAAGGRAIAIQADVSLESDVQRLFHQVNAEWGPVRCLVNNAGMLQTQMPLQDMSFDRFQATMNTNVLSGFLCCRAFIRQAEGAGAIVNVTSVAARTGAPFEYVDYAASKAAMDAITKGLSIELAARNIRVNSVRPAFIYTDMHADGGEPERVERLIPQIPLQRGGTPEEVAHAIAWLLSDEASYITGTFLDLAGGK
ncbi:glucose 1-dehydrogenase [Planctobacterium marinum]|uniref:glucose 1-dehydrogenase n=1 Tax=Planctobacterium marinum TaxID=1631968 RepID=UPI001E4DCD39|nr:glucose 1-dehydrogenase [Planctobacterium marinum]MCC2604446.1 glucose 1-dehydrogenase [Planctobacterium marinum]